MELAIRLARNRAILARQCRLCHCLLLRYTWRDQKHRRNVYSRKQNTSGKICWLQIWIGTFCDFLRLWFEWCSNTNSKSGYAGRRNIYIWKSYVRTWCRTRSVNFSHLLRCSRSHGSCLWLQRSSRRNHLWWHGTNRLQDDMGWDISLWRSWLQNSGCYNDCFWCEQS